MLECDISLLPRRVLRILDRAVELHGKARRLRTDKGPEFTNQAFHQWCYKHGVEHHTGKPVEKAFAESFNSGVRDGLLNEHSFISVRYAQDLIDD